MSPAQKINKTGILIKMILEYTEAKEADMNAFRINLSYLFYTFFETRKL